MTGQAAQSFTFRRFAEGDSLNELHALVHAVFGALPIDPPSSALRETPAHFSARAKTQAIFIAAAGEQLAGAIFCEPLDDALHVGRLAVHPEWRQRGVSAASCE
jgi:ribosomal protein S18 acetylase RimI-like enzyme